MSDDRCLVCARPIALGYRGCCGPPCFERYALHEGPPHGTADRYRRPWSCRCEDCVAAHARAYVARGPSNDPPSIEWHCAHGIPTTTVDAEVDEHSTEWCHLCEAHHEPCEWITDGRRPWHPPEWLGGLQLREEGEL